MIPVRAALMVCLLSSSPAWSAGSLLLAGTLPRLLPPEQFEAQQIREYTAAVLERLLRDQTYPALALQNAWQGTARVNMTIGPDGTIKGARVVQTSGHAVLDDEAVHKVIKLSGLPRPPSVLRGREFRLAVPVSFRID